MSWHSQRPTPRQLSALQQFGLDPDLVQNKGHASVILDKVFARRSLGLASPKQVAWLRRTGHPRPDTATFAEATSWLSQKFGRNAA
jgi:hypothetical protein